MSCTNPITNVPYQIGDTGPGGGIIFSIPGQGNNSTNFYFEAAPVDVSTTQRAQVSTTLGQTQTFDCTGTANFIPGAEFGVHEETISPNDNGSNIGDGLSNTVHLNSYPTSWGGYTGNPTNPVLDIHDLAAKLCVDYIGPNGDSDWFLPSLTEMIELVSSLSVNLSTSTSHPASAFYWTSSVLAGPPGTVFDTIAAGVNVVAGNPQIMDRCSTGSVRPVRMFECPIPPSTGIDYNYRYDSQGKDSIGGCWMYGYDVFGELGGITQFIIGKQYLQLSLNKFDARLNRSTPTSNLALGGNMGVTSPNNPITAPINWYGPPAYSWLQPNPYKITIYDLNEQLVGSWTYSDINQISSCRVDVDCYFKVTLSNPTPDPGTPTTFNLDSLVYPLPNPLAGFQTPCGIGQTNPGKYPYYILVENVATQEIMTSPLGNGVGNTINLTNYAGTGNNMRFIDNSGISISPINDFYYNNACCVGVDCYFHRWFAELPPTHSSFNIDCDGFSLHPWYESVLYEDCAAASLACLPSGGVSKLIGPINQDCIFQNITVKSTYVKNENQTVEVTYGDDAIFIEEENDVQKMLFFNYLVSPNSIKNIFNITFKTNEGYYYSKSPSLSMNFPGSENYKVKVESENRNSSGYVIEKTFNINYKNTGFDVFDVDGHNIMFTNKITKEVVESEAKEITALSIDKSSINSSGESRNISVAGTPGSTFSLTIKDKNGRNVLPYTNSVTKTIKTIVSASATLELNNATGLEVGMVVLNDQRRGVKITGISNPAETNVDAINETSTTYITISSHLTFAANDNVTFVKETDITEVAIPSSGIYSFTQKFPVLEKFKRTLKTVAYGTTSLNLDYNDDLEDDMKITGTGVDGNNPIISSDGVNADGVTITVSDSQTIADETELTFEMPDNRYDITIKPLMALLNSNVLSTCSIYQYVDPIVQIVPSTTLSNVTTTGTVTFTDKANTLAVGTAGDITINMVATKSDGTLIKSREPRFSSSDSTLSDFSNTLNTTTKIVREDIYNTTIVHLNNITGIRVGMIVTGESIDANKTVTVKSIVGTTVKLSSKLTIQKDDTLVFNSMFNMSISSLTATLTDNGGLSNGVCTVTGTGKIRTFGIDSFVSTFNFDNFLSV